MAFEDQVKAFGMTNMLLESDIEAIEKKYDIELQDRLEKPAASGVCQGSCRFNPFAQFLFGRPGDAPPRSA